ncbi:CHAT domain-containing protein [Ephemerocybe angulata]|uniref:CHAT domain-containing protein n=1 Tax=Ephemerocybe angulata TaxID=980116 RepID=A0A8H6HU20_9AGAR|nr:CHAT domain-containing protein [Tulosesus angulatus]
MYRYERMGELSDISEAIAAQQKAVDLIPRGHADLPAHLSNLGCSLTRRFERTGELSDIAEAIAVQQKAMDLTPEGYTNLPNQLTNLGASFTCRFERTGELSDIVNAVAVQQKAVDITPLGHCDLPSLFNNLGGSLLRQFERTGELSVITNSIIVLQKAVDLTPRDHADLAGRLNNLGTSFIRRFNQTGELSDITNAIEAQQRAVALTPQDHADLPSRLNNLGGMFMCQFERIGELPDIANAITALQKAIDLIPRDHTELPRYLNCLGRTLACRFDRKGDLSDIANAISVLQKAVYLTAQGHSDLPLFLTTLGASFGCRFERMGQLSDIENAIAILQKAVDLTPQNHANLPGRLDVLGRSFISRFGQTGDLSDIVNAIAAQQKAVDLTPQGYAELPGYLANLGCSFGRRFARGGELSDIMNAIALQQKAKNLIPQGHPNLPKCLSMLGTSFTLRLVETGELSDIANAITVQRKGVDLTPEGHAKLPAYLSDLGQSFYYRYRSNGHVGDLEEALLLYQAAAVTTVGPPRLRLTGARRWAGALTRHRPSSVGIIIAFDTALDLISMIAGLEQTVKGRYSQLEDLSCLALEAAAAACALDRTEKALEWLEQGRCLVWSQINDLRTPLDTLRIYNATLANEIADVSRRLEHAGSSRGHSHPDMSMSKNTSLEDEALEHVGLASRWDELLKTARAITGFESFLMAPSCSAIMQHLPESGPVIVVNVYERRCDALALLPGLDKPRHIPLPNFTVEKAVEYRIILDSQLRAHQLRVREVGGTTSAESEFLLRSIRSAPVGKHGEDPVHRVLRGLWEEVVKPVLEALGFSVTDHTETPPRVWWCPTGPLSFLPLHAAGIYRGSDTVSVFDYVVSSYTPTVSAITDRVKNSGSRDDTASGLFLTSQPNVDGAPPIPGTTSEVHSIFDQATKGGVRVQKLEGDEMTVAECIARMQDFSCVHLACHGSQNAADPLQSSFLFHEGPLELGTILKSNLKNADLAFLSACQTSTGQERLSDEAVHLAAGMLAAGYRRVIATMWSIGDAPAQQVATTFYEYLFNHRDETDGATFDATDSAVALHHATQQLRLTLDDSQCSLLTWIPFVHFGL